MSRSVSQHWKGTKAFIFISTRELRGEPVFVEPAEAEQRATICATGNQGRRCPQNVNDEKSRLERMQDGMIAAKLDGRTTSKDTFLGSCAVCSCELRTLVHMLPEVIMHGAGKKFLDEHPSFCWKQQFKNLA